MSKKKVALVILDGWGIGDHSSSDAVWNANTPVFDRLINTYPNATLKTYGEHVGLPEGQMGNSEVGHLNIGAGRIVYQDLVKINRALESHELASNEVLNEAMNVASAKESAIHLMGLLSHGGVHSSQDHLHGLIELIEQKSDRPIYIHAFTDGRDTDPRNAIDCIKELEAFIEEKPNVHLASMIGRYYAMDRDKRWERTKIAYDLLVNGKGTEVDKFSDAVKKQYDQDITDEFFEAHRSIQSFHPIAKDDVVICFNFRTDRCRQITQVLTQRDMPEFGMNTIPLHYVTMTRYDEAFEGVKVLFEKDNIEQTLGEVVSRAGLKQLRAAETEKYPHVTFFFSGGREEPFEGEKRIMANSPKVATYDLQPEMSAHELTSRAVKFINEMQPEFVCLNFANPDMVGHTGVYDAIVKAVETTDECLGELIEAGLKHGYEFIVIADHGNADKTKQDNGSPHTAHTTNPVPVILVSDRYEAINEGILADVAPTICNLLSIDQPLEMTGNSLI